jgi:hypothetical protein
MKRLLWLVLFLILSANLVAQNFEITGLQDSYKGTIGEVIKAPLQFKNNSTKVIHLIIRKSASQIGTSQRNYFCPDGDCLDQTVEDYIVKVEPGQTLNSFQVALEAGLVPGISSVKYLAFNKSNPNEVLELDLNFVVEEKSAVTNIYSSRAINLQDVYPNPASEYAYVNYKVLSDEVKAKMVLHNVLGSPVAEYDLPSADSRVKIRTEELNAGIYFYTLYIDSKAVMTRKLVVKK